MGLQQVQGSTEARNGGDGWPIDEARIAVEETDSAVIEGGQEGVERTSGGLDSEGQIPSGIEATRSGICGYWCEQRWKH